MPDEFVTAFINKDYLTLLLPGLDVGNNEYIIILCNFGSCRIMSCFEIIEGELQEPPPGPMKQN